MLFDYELWNSPRRITSFDELFQGAELHFYAKVVGPESLNVGANHTEA
jgi:hypothetical protein